MIDAAYVAAEIVCSRFVDGKAAGPLSFLADDAGFHAFVQGESLRGATQSSLLHAPASLYRDGKPVGEPLYGDDCTDPLAALERFWVRAAKQGTEVESGAIITTGTLIRPFEFAPPGEYEGRLGDRRVAFRI
jgi:2-keto-4-pentenoate hydratase